MQKDNLEELEALVLSWCLEVKGLKLLKEQDEEDTKWEFEVCYVSFFKKKHLTITLVKDIDTSEAVVLLELKCETVKEMYEKAFEFFKVGTNNG